MIIFDLAALANDEHRRHFIDPPKEYEWGKNENGETLYGRDSDGNYCDGVGGTWKPDYQAYYDACDKDEPVKPVTRTAISLIFDIDTEIWSSQHVSSKDKCTKWITENVADISYLNQNWSNKVKMRPNDDTRPQQVLFEEWLDATGKEGLLVDFFFSSHKPTIEMFIRRGVFVFDCNQGK